MELNLKSLRREIDRIDNGILQMLQKRLEVARLVVRFKKEQHQDINVPSREQEILTSLKSRERSLLSADVIEEIYKILFTESKRLQAEAKPLIAFQGAHGAFSEVAARQWDSEITPVPCPEFADVFEGVVAGSYEYGIVPIENTVGGMMSQVNGYLLHSDLQIVGAVEMAVSHALLIVPGTDYRNLRRVYSHPVALAECQQFIQRMKLEPYAYYDTAGAAKMLAETWKDSTAVIASVLAAKYYNLEVLKEGIGDVANTRTRFVVLSRKPLEVEGEKCSITFVTENKAGALFRIMQLFAEKNINLTRIDSVPDEKGNYVFFLDFTASNRNDDVKKILETIEQHSLSYRFLGCYSEK
ncbi:MAG: prephenate dehydratase domain-containing protein [Planctomycetia bacterium]|nr:prephenate dehydratase domain-containing protein [Planctomycetia bacterium]